MEQRGRAHGARLIAVAFLGAVLAGLMGANAAAGAEDGKAVFGRLCQGCHTIGGGTSVGPDLEGLADRRELDWAREFILAPDKVLASGDPTAKSLVEEYGTQMPNLGVTAAQATALLEYLGYAASSPPAPTEPAPTEPAPTEPAPTETAPATPVTGSAARGKSLFTGSERFDAGGPACVSCHSVAGVGALGGGRLGPDLTGSFAKFGGAQGLDASLATIPFPTMLPIFSRKALTADERADLAAFLATAPDQDRPAGASAKLVGFSLVFACLLVLLSMGVWRHRLNGVRKPLVNRSRPK